MKDLDEKTLAQYFDHTLLKAEATKEDIIKLCDEAKTFGFHTVCVNGRWLELAAEHLEDSNVHIGGVVSLPLGADRTQTKVFQARDAIFAGADEIDMVADLAAVIDGDEEYLLEQFRAVREQCHSMHPPVTFKVIIESAALTKDQIRFVCGIAGRVGVDFVKTSTGMHPAGGASIEAVKLMKASAPNCKVKAAGGIRTLKQTLEMIEAGVERIGTSSAVSIMEEFRNK